MKVGVIIPSRLAPRPRGRELRDFGPELWLDGAMASVINQRGYNANDWEIFVGVDPNAVVPLHIYDHATIVRGQVSGQASAVNEAVEIAILDGCDVLMFLEDDDSWHCRKSEIMLPYLVQAPFLSCSQRLVGDDDPSSEKAAVLGINDFPAPSGWVMTVDLWKQVGGMNSSYRWMVDAEWLGRLNKLRVTRIHFKERGLPRTGELGHVGLHSTIVETDIPEFLVSRTVNSQSGMVKGGPPWAEAEVEVVKLRENLGNLPW